MGLFSHKPKLSIQDFCQNFYDSQMFHPVIAGRDVKWSYIDTVFDTAVEKDRTFQSIDKDKFRQEMMALRMEIIGLVFSHNIRRNDNLLLAQSLFTKNYLQQNNQTDIWEIMLQYNKIIAQSGYDIVSGERMKRGWDAFLNTYKIELLKEWESKGGDIECATRVINRYGTEVAWSKSITVRYLTARLADRLGCSENLSQEVLLILASVLRGFYQGAKEAIKPVKFE